MNKEKILLQLYMRESKKLALTPVNDLDLSYLTSEEYIDWRDSKRDIIDQDVADTIWLKTCTGGYVTEITFHQDGTLDEYSLFKRHYTPGKWHLSNGVLNIELIQNHNVLSSSMIGQQDIYSFSVVANKEKNIHSAIEYQNDELHTYLKLAPIK